MAEQGVQKIQTRDLIEIILENKIIIKKNEQTVFEIVENEVHAVFDREKI